MANYSSQFVQDANKLLTTYYQNLGFRRQFDELLASNKQVLFQGRLLKHYIYFFTHAYPQYRRRFQEIKKDQTKLANLLIDFYQNRRDREQLLRESVNEATELPLQAFTKQELQDLEKSQTLPENKRINAQEKIANQVEKRLDKENKEQKVIDKQTEVKPEVKPEEVISIEEELLKAPPQVEPTEIQAPPVSPVRPSVPGFVKNAASSGGILFKKFSTRYLSPLRIASFLSGAVGSTIGLTVAGPTGAIVGGGAGLAFPSFIRAGGGSLILRGGSSALALGGRGLLMAGVASSGIGPVIIIAIVALFGMAFLFFNLNNTLKSSVPLSISSTPFAPDFPGSTTVSSDIAQCQFTRADRQPPAAKFQSSQLIGYFQEVSQKTGVPAALLAGIARVEVPDSVNWTDANLSSQKCPESGDGAVGIMQIISQYSHRTDAFCRDCVENGARLLGKTVSQLSKADYCDPRTSIHLGAGFVLKKLSYPPNPLGDSTRWNSEWTNNQTVINKVASSFYGCLQYGGAICEGPYNYGTDLWTSLQSCRQITPVVPSSPNAPTPPSDSTTLASKIKDEFKIEFRSPFFLQQENYKFLRWSWEAFWAARYNAPNFIPLLNSSASPALVTTTSGVSFREGNTIGLTTRANGFMVGATEQQFKLLIIHELGHIIRGSGRFDNELQQVINRDAVGKTDGYLTGYGQDPCHGTTNVDEDFSETVTYYVNKNATREERLGCTIKSTTSGNPLFSGQYPSHLEFAKKILGEPPR